MYTYNSQEYLKHKEANRLAAEKYRKKNREDLTKYNRNYAMIRRQWEKINNELLGLAYYANEIF